MGNSEGASRISSAHRCERSSSLPLMPPIWEEGRDPAFELLHHIVMIPDSSVENGWSVFHRFSCFSRLKLLIIFILQLKLFIPTKLWLNKYFLHLSFLCRIFSSIINRFICWTNGLIWQCRTPNWGINQRGKRERNHFTSNNRDSITDDITSKRL